MTAGDVAGHLGDAMLELTAAAQGRRTSRSGLAVEPDRPALSIDDDHSPTPKPKPPPSAASSRATLQPATSCCCHGDLGAGKTAFVRGLAEGSASTRDEVSSPTFTLIQEYRGGRLTLVPRRSLPARRSARDRRPGAGRDRRADGVLAIEWAEKLPAVARLTPRARERRRDRIARRRRRRAIDRDRQFTQSPIHQLLRSVVRRFLRDRHVVHVALADAGRRDANQLAPRAAARDRSRSRSSPCRRAGRRPADESSPRRCPCGRRGLRCLPARACRLPPGASRSNSSWK